MIKQEVKSNYFYCEYKTDVAMYYALDDYLHQGFKITDSVYLAVEVSKNGVSYLLSYLHVEVIDENIKETIKSMYKEYELMYPDYNDTLLNVTASIRKNFHYSSDYEVEDVLLDKHYKHMIILILDGMGVNILNKTFPKDSYIKSLYKKSLHALYPSTTACATTAIKSALPPITTAWTGWENYLAEAKRNLILFTGNNYVTDEPTGISLYDYIPYDYFFSDMDNKGFCIEPDFSKRPIELNDVLNRSLDVIRNNSETVQYVYYTEPDGLMHEFGAYSNEAKRECASIDKKVKAYLDKLPEDTCVIITADHGHTNVEPLCLYECKPILDLLERRPSNDARCITFKVKPFMGKKFEEIFNALFGSVYKLYKTKDAIEAGFFGLKDSKKNKRVDDFLADYVAVATNKYYFNYKTGDSFLFKSHHAGITRDEMEIPICVFKK